MAQSTEERLLGAIKSDDVKAYGALAENARIGEYRLGRFPVLSLLYLYKARKILSAHESELWCVSAYIKRNEPAEISRKFSVVAGKCLRLYYDEAVSPPEMLLILDRVKYLTRTFPNFKTTEQIKARLQSIYAIKYALNVRFEGENIIIDKRPLSYREKKKIITASLCAALGVAVAVCVPTITVSLFPKVVDGEVNKLSDINFTSKKEYVLNRDIVLNKAIDAVNCTIKGNGHKLIFGDGASFGTFGGTLTDMTIENSGGVIFQTVSSGARIADVTINIAADVESDENTALVAAVNYGVFEGVTVNVKGSVAAADPSDDTVTELTFGGMVLNNGARTNEQTQTVEFGVIKNCTVNYSQFELVGDTGANAAFGGIVGFNNGYLNDCTVTGGISSDTLDVAGVCLANYGDLSGCENRADIKQTSAQEGWNSIVCGVVMNNSYILQNCKNTGRISAESTCGTTSDGSTQSAIAAGIVYFNNYSQYARRMFNCVNLGNIESTAVNGSAYAAGVCYGSNGGIELCANSGAVTAVAGRDCEAYVGGIADYAYGYVYKSTNDGDVSALGTGLAFAGGISAYARAQFLYNISSGNVSVTSKNVYAGGIFGVSEIDNYGVGTAEYCISENSLDVTAVGGEAYVGGIAGYVKEQRFTVVGGGTTYLGGGVTGSCFVGTCVNKGVYFGNIVGVSGANIYSTNSYTSNGTELRNFDGNYYVNNSFKAFAATLSNDGTNDELTADVDDKGATSLTIEAVKNTATYKQILTELAKV